MLRKSLIALILLITHYQLPITLPKAAAQTMRSADYELQITDLDFKLSDVSPDTPRAPEEFRRNGYLVSQLPPDTTISRPFTTTPGTYLLRAKPGGEFTLPLKVFNFKDPVVLKVVVMPFTVPAGRQVASPNRSDAIYGIKNNDSSIEDVINHITTEEDNFFLEAGAQRVLPLQLQIPEDTPEGDYYLKVQLSIYDKPYLYTSTDIYLTITNSGVIQQNISVEKLGAPRFIFGAHRAGPLQIHVVNGSPYFDVFHPILTYRSPLGFEKTQPIDPIVLTANQQTTVNIDLKDIPWGPVKLSLGNNSPTRWVFFLPLP